MNSTQPLMLGVRFLLELAALAAFGRSGYELGGVLGALGLPVAAATVWGVFNVPNDPSRSGRAPVPVRGVVRLGLELAFFACATAAVSRTEWAVLAWWLGGGVVLLYVVGFDRLRWLRSH